jgi:predicted nucleic acid-binding protein
MPGHSPDETVMLDACCVLNLCASGLAEQILRELPMSFGIAERVTHEALFVLPGAAGDDPTLPEPIDLARFAQRGLLTIHSIQSAEEAAAYVAFASDLDDGESMTCAIAVHRGYAVATDDRKALRVIRQRAAQIRVLRTTDLLRLWAERASIGSATLRGILVNVKDRGRFVPRQDDPNRSWWDTSMNAPDR